jgi:hypothetical protein
MVEYTVLESLSQSMDPRIRIRIHTKNVMDPELWLEHNIENNREILIGFFYLKEWLLYVDSLLFCMLGVHRDNFSFNTFTI